MGTAGSGGAVVVGGGITGLAAAYQLTRAGVPVMLVEASDRLGGKIRTERLGGFLVEAGPDSFIAYRPAATELSRELGLGEAIIRTTDPRVVHIRARGEMIPMPEGMGLVLPTRLAPFVTTRLFSWPQKLRAGLDVVLPRWLDGEDVSIGAFLRHRLGGAMVDRLADPLLGGIYGAPVDELSLFAVVPQLRDYERDHRSLLFASLAQGRAARARARAAATAGGSGSGGGSGSDGGSSGGFGAGSGSPFLSLAGGMESLVDALATVVRSAAGAEIRLRTSVVALERDGPCTAVTLSDGTRLRPHAVVLAGPAGSSADLLADKAPAAAAAIRSIPHGSTGVVTLGYRAEALPGPLVGHGFLVAGDDPLSFGACTFTSSKWAGRAPEGTILLRAFLPERSAALLDATDDAVVAAVHADLARTMGVREAPIVRQVARWHEAMPRYTVGHLDRVAAAEAALAARPEIVLVGAAFHGVGVPDCVARGRAAAERVITLAGRE
jgi:oxygen-dependent protoporphyrinogen oxidase